MHDKTFVTDEHVVDTVLVDTAGHELFRWLVKPICDPNAFFVLCFDLINRDSLRAVETFMEGLEVRRGRLFIRLFFEWVAGSAFNFFKAAVILHGEFLELMLFITFSLLLSRIDKEAMKWAKEDR